LNDPTSIKKAGGLRPDSVVFWSLVGFILIEAGSGGAIAGCGGATAASSVGSCEVSTETKVSGCIELVSASD